MTPKVFQRVFPLLLLHLASSSLPSRLSARIVNTGAAGNVATVTNISRPRWPLVRRLQGLGSPSSSTNTSPTSPHPHHGVIPASSIGITPTHPALALARGLSTGLQRFVQILHEKSDHLIAGAVARGVMVSSLYPVDTIKTRVQMFGGKEAMRFEPRILYAGLSSSMIGQIPYGCMCFGFYEVYKDLFLVKFPQISRDAINLAAAVLSDVTGSVWLCPSEVIKQQMQSGVGAGGASLTAAVMRTWREQGPAGFFQGYGGQLLRDIPFRALQLPLYERSKELIDKHFGHHQHTLGDSYATWKEGMAGVISGSIASAVTTPFDVVKTRLMVDSSYRGAFDCGIKIAKKEGMAGLFRGVIPRVLYTGPSTALFFIAYNAVRTHLLAQPAFASSLSSSSRSSSSTPADAIAVASLSVAASRK